MLKGLAVAAVLLLLLVALLALLGIGPTPLSIQPVAFAQQGGGGGGAGASGGGAAAAGVGGATAGGGAAAPAPGAPLAGSTGVQSGQGGSQPGQATFQPGAGAPGRGSTAPQVSPAVTPPGVTGVESGGAEYLSAPAEMPPAPATSPLLGTLLRDPATVASELLVDPSDPAFVARERPAAARWANRAYVNDVSNAVSRLRRQVVQLKGDMTSGVAGDQRRLSRQADDVLDVLDDFADQLRVGRRRSAVAEDYAAVESRVRALAYDARAAGLGNSASGWVAMADERLGGVVSRGGVRDVWEPALVIRDADNEVFLARDLERQGEYGLSAGPGRRTLQDDLHALTDAAEFFRGSVAAGSPRSRLAQDFEQVEDVWARVAPAVGRLSRDERLLLVPRAQRVGDVIVKLHQRLGLAGTPRHVEELGEPARPVSASGPVLPASAPR